MTYDSSVPLGIECFSQSVSVLLECMDRIPYILTYVTPEFIYPRDDSEWLDQPDAVFLPELFMQKYFKQKLLAFLIVQPSWENRKIQGKDIRRAIRDEIIHFPFLVSNILLEPLQKIYFTLNGRRAYYQGTHSVALTQYDANKDRCLVMDRQFGICDWIPLENLLLAVEGNAMDIYQFYTMLPSMSSGEQKNILKRHLLTLQSEVSIDGKTFYSSTTSLETFMIGLHRIITVYDGRYRSLSPSYFKMIFLRPKIIWAASADVYLKVSKCITDIKMNDLVTTVAKQAACWNELYLSQIKAEISHLSVIENEDYIRKKLMALIELEKVANK